MANVKQVQHVQLRPGALTARIQEQIKAARKTSSAKDQDRRSRLHAALDCAMDRSVKK
jgi:hypothetical protein